MRDRDGDTKGVATGPLVPSVGVAQRGVVQALCALAGRTRPEHAGANACVASEGDVFLFGQD